MHLHIFTMSVILKVAKLTTNLINFVIKYFKNKLSSIQNSLQILRFLKIVCIFKNKNILLQTIRIYEIGVPTCTNK